MSGKLRAEHVYVRDLYMYWRANSKVGCYLIPVNRIRSIYRTEHCFGLMFSPEWNSPFKERRRRKGSGSHAILLIWRITKRVGSVADKPIESSALRRRVSLRRAKYNATTTAANVLIASTAAMIRG